MAKTKEKTWKLVRSQGYYSSNGPPWLDAWSPPGRPHRYQAKPPPVPPGFHLDPDDWSGTIGVVSVHDRTSWEIISHPDPQLIGYRFSSNHGIINEVLNSGNTLPLVTGDFKWTKTGHRLGLDKL